MSRNVGLPPEDVSDLSVAVKILCDIRLVVAGFCFVLVGLDNLPDWLSWVLVAQLAVSLVLLLKWHEWGGRIVTGWLWPIGETACLLVVFVDSHYWWATSMLMTTTVVFLACAGTWRTVFMAGLGLVAMTGAALAGLVPTVGWVDSSASGLNSYMMVIGMAASLVACEVMGWYLRFLMLRQGRLLRERAETGALEAAEWERVRTAEELHDGLGKTLSGSAMMAEALARQLARFDKPELGALAHDLADSLAIAVGESRALLEGLRGHGPGELVPACKLAAERFAQQDCGIEVETSFPQCPVIVDAATRHTVERAVGELLENVRLHSGAQKVSFTVTCDDGSARVCVADDGVGLPDGFDLEAMGKAGHFGLLGLRERMEKVSGKCDFTSSERGTTVALTVPLMARDSEGEVHASAGR